MRRRIVISIVVVIAIFTAGVTGIGWYFSGKALAVNHSITYDNRLRKIDGDTAILARTADSLRAGTFAIQTPTARAIVTDIVSSDVSSVVRKVKDVQGTFANNVNVKWDEDVWASDPKQADGIDFTTVQVHGDLGDMPAWQISGRASTWVIAIHGRAGARKEALRVLPSIVAAGMPALVVSYRNDVGAPASPDKFDHFGDTEWRDVDAAIRYAKASGAKKVVLYGWSMGGAIAMVTLHRSGDAGMISGLVLDAPVADWRSVLDEQGRQNNLPLAETRVAEKFISQRIKFNFKDFDEVRQADTFHVPVLLYVPLADGTVPPEPAQELAKKRPDLFHLVTSPTADHTQSWNVDPLAYDNTLRAFLAPFAA